MKKSPRYSPKIKERAIGLVYEQQKEHRSQWATIVSIASKIGCTPETLQEWIRRHEIDHGNREGLSTAERERTKRAVRLCGHIQRIWHDNYGVYGARNVWHQLLLEGVTVACCTIERLMKRLGIEGIRRGKVIKTTLAANEPLAVEDKINRQFRAAAPNEV